MTAARYPVMGTCIVRKRRERLSDNSADSLSRAAQAGREGKWHPRRRSGRERGRGPSARCSR
jgi:hypothetical protein